MASRAISLAGQAPSKTSDGYTHIFHDSLEYRMNSRGDISVRIYQGSFRQYWKEIKSGGEMAATLRPLFAKVME